MLSISEVICLCVGQVRAKLILMAGDCFYLGSSHELPPHFRLFLQLDYVGRCTSFSDADSLPTNYPLLCILRASGHNGRETLGGYSNMHCPYCRADNDRVTGFSFHRGWPRHSTPSFLQSMPQKVYHLRAGRDLYATSRQERSGARTVPTREDRTRRRASLLEAAGQHRSHSTIGSQRRDRNPDRLRNRSGQ